MLEESGHIKNYHELKQIILDEILKDRKTSIISKRMGFNFDKVARWHNGTKQLRWDEFCELCKVSNVPLLNALKEIGFFVKTFDDAFQIVRHLKNTFHHVTIKDYAEMSQTNLSSMNRFIKADSYPNFEFVLSLIDQRDGRLSIFSNSLLGKKDEAMASIIKYPWMPAVASVMGLKQFSNKSEALNEHIAAYLGIPLSEVDLAFQEFIKLGLIKKNGPLYEVNNQKLQNNLTASGSAIRMEINDLIKYWTKFISKKMKSPSFNDAFGKDTSDDHCIWRVFTCDHETSMQIDEVLARTEKEIHELLEKNTNEPNDVRVILLHHFSTSFNKDSESI